MEHLLSIWPKVLKHLQIAKRILLFCDYDGTLTPIVESPEKAVISDYNRHLLQSLSERDHIKVGIISGRSLADLKNKININGLIYAGNHGFEIDGPGLSFVSPVAEEVRPYFHTITRLLTLAFETIRGVFVENKGLTLSIHYRQMENRYRRKMNLILQKVINENLIISNFKVTPGKKVIELKPYIDWNKGQAIKLLMNRYGGKGQNIKDTLPIYLGDDITDEDGFKVIKEFETGISVHIGNNLRQTTAEYFLESTEEVSEFLKILLDYSPESHRQNQQLISLKDTSIINDLAKNGLTEKI